MNKHTPTQPRTITINTHSGSGSGWFVCVVAAARSSGVQRAGSWNLEPPADLDTSAMDKWSAARRVHTLLPPQTPIDPLAPPSAHAAGVPILMQPAPLAAGRTGS